MMIISIKLKLQNIEKYKEILQLRYHDIEFQADIRQSITITINIIILCSPSHGLRVHSSYTYLI